MTTDSAECLSLIDAARALGYKCRETAARMVRRGELEAFKLPNGRVRVTRASLEKLLPATTARQKAF